MKELKTTTILCVFICAIRAVDAAGGGSAPWGYYTPGLPDDQSPSHWKDHYPICGHERQSPIHMLSDEAVVDESLGDLTFHDYDEPLKDHFAMINNGHTVHFSLTGNETGKISGGGLPATYKLMQFHFHWGSGNNNGSEHWLDDKQYAAELHLVHIKDEYETIADALGDPDGLAVLGIFVDVRSEIHNPKMQQIVTHLPSVAFTDHEPYTLEAFPLKDLLPDETKTFLRYNGSLTTPPCSESVIWTVFHQPIPLSFGQIYGFRNTLHHADNEGEQSDYKLEDNHRPPQDLHGRRVLLNRVPPVTTTAKPTPACAVPNQTSGAATMRTCLLYSVALSWLSTLVVNIKFRTS